MRVLGMAMAFVLFFSAVAQAEPLNLKYVAADAKWLMHVDADALRESVVVQKAYQKCLEMHKDAEKKMDMVCGMMGMDPRKDLHGMTVYGKDTNKEHGVMILHAKVNQKLLLQMVAVAPGHKVTTHGNYELHSWNHKCGKKEPKLVVGTFYKPDMLVFAGCEEAVKAALDVLDGKSAGIEGKTSPLAGGTKPGSIFVARASVIDPKTRCPVLKQSESFRVALGENKGQSFYRARLAMKSKESVEQVKAITEGFRAMVSLQCDSDAQAMKLIDGLKVASDGVTLNLRWDASAEDVWSVVEKAAKKWAERKGKNRGCPMFGDANKKCPLPKSKSKTQPKHEEEF